MITAIQLADWIVKHRGNGKAFGNYTYNKIVDELLTCAENDTMVTITGNSGEILGVVCGHKDNFRKVFHVYDILAIERGVLKRMVEYFRKKFPDFTLEGVRKNGKLIAYNDIERFSKLIKIYGK